VKVKVKVKRGGEWAFLAAVRTDPMADYEVKCVDLNYGSRYDDCRAIEAIGFEAVGGGFTRKTPEEVHRLIVVYRGERSAVRPAADGDVRYVRAADEDTADDPLLKQPSC
jgi:hypothetical protein